MLRNKTKTLSFKQAFIIVIVLHVVGFAGLKGITSYRSSVRKQELAEQKQKEKKESIANKDLSANEWPTAKQTVKPVVTKVPDHVLKELKEQQKQEDPPKVAEQKPVNPIVPLVQAALPKVVHTTPHPVEKKVIYSSHKQFDQKAIADGVKEVNKFITTNVEKNLPSEKEIVEKLDYYQTQFDQAKEIVLEEITTRVISSRPMIQ